MPIDVAKWARELSGMVALDPYWATAMLADPERAAGDIQAAIDLRKERALARQGGAVALVPVTGIITPRRTIWEEFGYATSAEGLRANLRAALDDPDVKAVVMDIHSPGGLASGLPELASDLRAMRGDKPIIAQVDYLAASAAYWIAAQADEIVASPSADAGSIGVFMLHADYSKLLDEAGVKMTFISAGKHKVDGNPYEPLSEDAEAHFQAQVDHTYGQFVGDVAQGRGVRESAVRGGYGEGRTLNADAALAAGMVDKIRSLEETLSAYGVAGSGSNAKVAVRRESRRLAFDESPYAG